MAAEYGRLDVIDQLLSAAIPVDGVDADWGPRLYTRPCTAGEPTASGISLPTARIQAGAIPDSAAHHWAGAATGATRPAPDTATRK